MEHPIRRPGQPRDLDEEERSRLLAIDRPAHLATLDSRGFPHVVPIWFIWDGAAFVMSSLPHRPHVRRLETNPAACVCVDIEEPERNDGERPNRQIRGVGNASLDIDVDGEWTRRITMKHLHGPGATAMADRRAGDRRVVIRFVPEDLIAVASI